MKVLPLLVVVASVVPALAESTFERELTQLANQHDQQVAAATEPLNRKYKEALEGLLKRATQGNDLDAALKVRQALGQSAPLAPVAAAAAAGGELTKRGLESRLEGVSFVTTSNNWLHEMTFDKGKIIHNPDAKGQGRVAAFRAVDGATILFQWDGKPATISFAGDLSSCTRGNVQFTKK